MLKRNCLHLIYMKDKWNHISKIDLLYQHFLKPVSFGRLAAKILKITKNDSENYDQQKQAQQDQMEPNRTEIKMSFF